MAARSFIIFAHPAGWHVGINCADDGSTVVEVPSAEDVTVQDVAKAVRTVLDDRGYTGQGVVLGVPSPWCLCAPVSTDGLPRKKRRQAMVYRLEEKLPVAVEQITADFIERGDEALGVCVLNRRLEPIVEALEHVGVAVESICPTALLALQHQLGQNDDAAPDMVILTDRDDLSLFTLTDDRPRAWSLLPQDAHDVMVRLGLECLNSTSKLHLRSYGLEPVLRDQIAGMAEVESLDARQTPMLELATEAAEGVLAGKPAPWTNLRRGALAVEDPYRQIRTPLRFATAALLCSLVFVSAAALWRSNHYGRLTRDLEARQVAAFRQVLPAQRVPGNVRLRLLSEEKKLRGLSGESFTLPQQESALFVMYEALRRLPTDLRFRVLEMRIDADRLYLDGQARAHSEADLIAAALRKQRGFNVEPPRTEKLEAKGVSFIITGVAEAASPLAMEDSP